MSASNPTTPSEADGELRKGIRKIHKQYFVAAGSGKFANLETDLLDLFRYIIWHYALSYRQVLVAPLNRRRRRE